MLNYPTCKALKEAGYPQKGTILVLCDDDPEMPAAPRVYVEADNGHPRFKLLACPVSDELLAAMQERWPELEVHTATSPPGGVSQAMAGDRTKQTIGQFLIQTRPTLAQALAALYIALAGGGA